ncbi:MAG TPA: 50S ribosomal protein L10, partial [Bacilli bacterium]|nr:50S ribosomal protein L10 [Bacilli bacterium]
MKETTIAKKSAQVDELVSKFQESSSIVLVDYLGLTVEKVSKLRRELYNNGCELKVVKNNILRRAIQKLGYEGLDEYCV